MTRDSDLERGERVSARAHYAAEDQRSEPVRLPPGPFTGGSRGGRPRVTLRWLYEIDPASPEWSDRGSADRDAS